MHGVLRISGLPHSDKIKYLNSEDATVAHVVSIREEAPTAAEVEAAAACSSGSRGYNGRAGGRQEGRQAGRCGQETRGRSQEGRLRRWGEEVSLAEASEYVERRGPF